MTGLQPALHTIRARSAASPKLVIALFYLLLTLIFWGTFVNGRGLPSETGFIELSQVRPGLAGFLYPYDASRQFMSLGFHLAFLLSNGSYLSLHVLFGLLIFLTGWLGYLITWRLVPESHLLAFIVGAMAITYGADGGALWAGYIVQRQTTVFALLAVLLLLIAWDRRNPFLLLPAALAQYLSLWTYEACLPVLFFTPLILYRRAAPRRRLAAYSAAWSLIPVVKIYTLVYQYWILHQATYQSRTLDAHTSVMAAAERLDFLLTKGLAFETWPAAYQFAWGGCGRAVGAKIGLPLAAGLPIFVAGFLLVRRSGQLQISPKRLGWLVAAGLFFLVLAYVPFLPLSNLVVRTQFVSAVPAAIVLSCLAALADSALRLRSWLVMVAASAVVVSGLAAGLLEQLSLSHDWAGYRKVMKAIVAAAPCIKDDTMILLVGVPARMSYSLCQTDPPFDPFRDVLWFNSGLQVLYENTRLVGLYYRADGSTTDSIRFKFTDKGAVLDRAGVGVEGKYFPYDRMIAFQFDPANGAVLLKSFPPGFVPGSTEAIQYQPGERVSCQVAPKVVQRRLQW